MARNVVLLEQTMSAIEAGALHIQTNWCRCFAGNALRQAGFPVADSVTKFTQGEDFMVEDRDGERRTISEVAGKELGLTWDERMELFYAGNTEQDLRSIVNTLIQKSIGDEILQTMAEPQLV